jgi:hypothetical protein
MIHLIEKHYLEVPEKIDFVMYDLQKDDEQKLTYSQPSDFSAQLGRQLFFQEESCR